jgi:hypothetical protein
MMEEHIDGLHTTVRDDGDVKVTNPDTQSTLFLKEEELEVLLDLVRSEDKMRPIDEAMEEAAEHLGEAADCLQDAGDTQALIKVEEVLAEVKP